jgi:salicylate hydroxylase
LTDIAIIGAGIGGLTLAVGLHRAGLRPRIFERAGALNEVGAGLTLAPNAMRAYGFLGLKAAIVASSDCPERAGLMDFATGVLRHRTDLARSFHQIHRADMQALLANTVTTVDPDAIRLGQEFERFEDGRRVRFASGATVDADIVVGCDGNRSAVRQALFGPDRASFLNYVAWRGLVPAAAVRNVIADLDTGGYVGSGRSLIRYLIRKGTLVNYVAFARKSAWTEDGWSIRSSIDELEREFAGGAADVMTILRATPPEATFKWGLIGRPPLEQWTKGSGTLLGDAAHPMLPFLGQGAGMAIEDAVILTRALTTFSDPREALARYEAARRPRATLVTLGARHAGFRMHGIDDMETSEAGRQYNEAFVADYDPAAVAV